LELGRNPRFVGFKLSHYRGSETIGGFADLFALADRRHKLYARKPAAHRMEFDLPHHGQPEEKPQPQSAALVPTAGFDYQKEADRIVLGKYTLPGVVVNEHLDILQFRGHMGPYLEPASGAASLNLLKMAREGLLLDLRGAINDAKRRNGSVRREGVQVKSNGGFCVVNIEVIPLHPTSSVRTAYFLVLFEEAVSATVSATPKTNPGRHAKTPPDSDSRLVPQLRQELAATKEYLQSIIAEHERANEELQSANEENLSSNEELQSTNEELTTAKEELQSTNEELTTVNDELHTRNGELGLVNSDLVNLLNSVQIPIVILGGDLRIRRFTPPAERVLNLIPTDVGRPLSDLRPNIVVPDFEQLLAGVMDSLAPTELEVQNREGRWFSLRIRPYKTLENKIDGVILALIDIDAGRRALAQAREAQEFAEAVVETVREPLLVLDGDLRVKSANHAFYKLFKARPAETENRFFYDLGQGEWNIAKLHKLLDEVLPKNSRFENFEVDSEFPGVGRKKLVLNARRIADDGSKTQCILLAMAEGKG
jgi:two-component system CheB/CheR fusion protein